MTSLEKRTIFLIKKIYESHPAGGALHIVLDDGNFADHCIQWCLENSIREIKSSVERTMFEECANNLLKMSMCRRYYCNRKSYEEVI